MRSLLLTFPSILTVGRGSIYGVSQIIGIQEIF
ncbi:hypothetical protein MMUC44124_00060 [Mycolicibacterium mucogenicum DSM 44124]|nr:hypothetical protein MMUC44124_00060 [Mycolicibacterium mucogenicum DSM 44124]